MSIELESTLALTAKLQAAEARAEEYRIKAAKWDEVANDYPTEAEADELHKSIGSPAECTTFGPKAIARAASIAKEREAKAGEGGLIPCPEPRHYWHGRDTPCYLCNGTGRVKDSAISFGATNISEAAVMVAEWKDLAELMEWWFEEENEAHRETVRGKRESSDQPWTAERWIAEIRAVKGGKLC